MPRPSPSHMSSAKWNEGWFSLHGRRGSISFAAAFVVLNLVFFLAVRPLTALLGVGALGLESEEAQDHYAFALGVAVLLAYILMILILVAQRLRDIGLSGWFALLWPVLSASTVWMPEGTLPAVTYGSLAVLAVIPGSRGGNRFG